MLAALLGVATAFDNPTRQAFVMELVGPEHVRNAVTLNSVLVNAARAVGPAVAGILIATVGVSICFLVNAGSYIAVIASLLLLDRSGRCARAPPAPRARGQLREGLRYVASTPGPRRAARDDGRDRRARLRVPGRAPDHRARDVRRRRRGLRLPDRRHGRRRRRRRPGRGRQRPHGHARGDLGELRLRDRDPAGSRGARPCRSSSPR